VVAGRARQETVQDVPTSVSAVTEEPRDKVSAREADRGAGQIIVTARRRMEAVGRGDWNVCTVNDPDQNLKKCKSLTRSDTKKDRGAAAASIADGIAHAWNGDLDGAIAAFGQAIALAPRNASAYLNRGMTYQRKGDLDRAIADFDQAVRNDPGAARGYYNRSVALREKGNERRARSDEQRAVEIDPGYADALR
jgi:tetratricopeptide (TPR) repeat protein